MFLSIICFTKYKLSLKDMGTDTAYNIFSKIIRNILGIHDIIQIYLDCNDF